MDECRAWLCFAVTRSIGDCYLPRRAPSQVRVAVSYIYLLYLLPHLSREAPSKTMYLFLLNLRCIICMYHGRHHRAERAVAGVTVSSLQPFNFRCNQRHLPCHILNLYKYLHTCILVQYKYCFVVAGLLTRALAPSIFHRTGELPVSRVAVARRQAVQGARWTARRQRRAPTTRHAGAAGVAGAVREKRGA